MTAPSGGDRSPLTGLPGPFAFADEVRAATGEGGGRFALLRVGIDGMGAYCTAYGFERGDGVIASTGRLLVDAAAMLQHPPSAAAHLGGAEFALLTAPDEAESTAAWLIAAFDVMVLDHYDDGDRARGFIEVLDRAGESRRWPILSVSIGVATTAARPLATHWDATAVAEELVTRARQDAGSSYFVDRRRK